MNCASSYHTFFDLWFRRLLTILGLLLFLTPGFGQMSHSLVKMYKAGDNIFPIEWQTERVNVKATTPRTGRAFALNELNKALGKYPKKFDSSIKNIFLVGRLFYVGQRYPASHSDDAVYIAIEHNYDIEKIFHREFSQLLLSNNRPMFDLVEWNRLSYTSKNHSDTYTTENIYASQQLNPSLFEEGFLASFALASWENDVSMYAENLFSGGKQFWQIVDQYPLIKKKTLLVIAFYHNLNPVYTENWFRFISDFRLF